jgi:hypothetical protein
VSQSGGFDPSYTPSFFKVGDRVRISHMRNIFTREYDEKLSGEIFVVSERRLRGGLPIYRLKDYLEDEIKGIFYQAELQKVNVRDDDELKVETTLRTKGRGRDKQYLVKWLH